MPDNAWWHVLWPDPALLARVSAVRPGERVVDVGCGDGYFTIPVARTSGAEVVGIDLDRALLERAAVAAGDAGVAITWRAADAGALEQIVTAPVDVVLVANTFHGVPDKPALCRHIRRVLAPGGRLVVVNWEALPREETVVLGAPRGPRTELRLSPAALRAIVEPEGFVLRETRPLPPWHYVSTFRVA